MIDNNSYINIHDKNIRILLFNAHNGKCFYTNKMIKINSFDIDHIIPIKHGGKNIIKNIVPCDPCLNRRKNCKYDFILLEKMIFLNELMYCEKIIKMINKNSTEKIKTKISKSILKHPLLEKSGYFDIVCNLVQIRKSIPMTQEGMADWLKVDRRKIMALENGEINISLLLNYAHNLSIDVKLTFELN